MQTHAVHLNLFRHLVRPVRGGAAGVVIIFALLFTVAHAAGFFGLWLALILSSWLFKYAYILFDHTVRGFDEPPALAIEMVNPWDEQRPLGQVVILALILSALYFTANSVGVAPAIALAAMVLFCLPASIAVLGVEGNILTAAYPGAWFRMIKGMGSLYWLVLLVIGLYMSALSFIGNLNLWFPLESAVGMFALLSIYSFLGGVVYERRDELGIETWASPERTEEQLQKHDLRENEAQVLEAYGLMRAGSHLKSWQMLEAWLKSRGNVPDDYRWLCERTLTWDDPRYATRLAEEHVARLLYLKRTGEALTVLSKRLSVDPAFRPKTAADTLNLAQLASRGGGMPGVARTLLKDFDTRFAGDPRVALAASLAQHLGGAKAPS